MDRVSLDVLAVLDMLVSNNSLTWGCVLMHPPEDPIIPMSALGASIPLQGARQPCNQLCYLGGHLGLHCLHGHKTRHDDLPNSWCSTWILS